MSLEHELTSRELDYEVAGLGVDAVDYLAAWDLQRRVHAEVVAGERRDTVLLLEHPPVFTAGKRTTPDERPLDPGGADVTSTFEPGAHDAAYWRRMLPDQLAFLGAAVGSSA